MCVRVNAQTTRSEERGLTGSPSYIATRVNSIEKPFLTAFRPATASISGLRAIPVTLHPRRASLNANRQVPEPTSRAILLSKPSSKQVQI